MPMRVMSRGDATGARQRAPLPGWCGYYRTHLAADSAKRDVPQPRVRGSLDLRCSTITQSSQSGGLHLKHPKPSQKKKNFRAVHPRPGPVLTDAQVAVRKADKQAAEAFLDFGPETGSRALREKIANLALEHVKNEGLIARRPEGDIDRVFTRRLNEIFKEGALGKLKQAGVSERRAFLDFLASELGVQSSVQLVEPPSTPPEIWMGHDNQRGENPAQFIMRVYSKYMGRGLTVAHLRTLDSKLYQNYFDWLKKKEPVPKGFYLPTKEEWYDRLVVDPALFTQLSGAEQAKVHRALAQRDTRQKAKAPSPR